MSETGYGQPPKHRQFSKGKSGNPAGRPKGSKNIITILEEELNAPVVINENGKKRTRTKLQVTIRQTIHKAAMTGDLKAAQIVHGWAAQVQARSETKASTAEFTSRDREVLELVMLRLDLLKAESPHA